MSGDIRKLNTSWTKYDIVKLIESIIEYDFEDYREISQEINPAVYKAFFCISNIDDELDSYWNELKNYPAELPIFVLLSALFTHHKNISNFANEYSSSGSFNGLYTIKKGDKFETNVRSALVVSGASPRRFRKERSIPYDFGVVFSNGEIGSLFRKILDDKLKKIGYSKEEITNDFFKLAYQFNFHSALSLTKSQFKKWINGQNISTTHKFDYDIVSLKKYQNLRALKVNQWLLNWDDINFNDKTRRKPDPHFFLFNIDVRLLKRLADVHRRKAITERIKDSNTQRDLDKKRTEEIKKYVEGGFPWSTISKTKQKDPEYSNVKMPGILPTAIIANILGPNQVRRNEEINNDDLIQIKFDDSGNPTLELPESAFNEEWNPTLKPLEIIDGQHRLWAFEESEEINGNYEVPVVAYYNLDRTWQAYLFYTINIKPKRINTSLGYDLYPLLRTQDWLENTTDGLKIYRETRAQELVEALWFYEGSPWFKRINMLGQELGGTISQASFIRALTDSFLRSPDSRNKIGGLFSSIIESIDEEIRWIRPQQAAFLIMLWQQIADETANVKIGWAEKLRTDNIQLTIFEKENDLDKSFASKNSMLARDQGVNGISRFSNDFFFIVAERKEIDYNKMAWSDEIREKNIDKEDLDKAIIQIKNSELSNLIREFSREIVQLDWRTTNAIFDNELERERQTRFKGSGGYSEIWKELLKQFLNSDSTHLQSIANELREKSGVKI